MTVVFLAIATAMTLLSFGVLAWPAWRRRRPDEPAASGDVADRPSARLLALLAAVLFGVTTGGYAWIGSPGSLGVRPGVPTTPTEQVAALLRQLEVRVQQQPSDAAAWSDLARADVAVGRQAAGIDAFRYALALRPADADLLTDLADVLAVVNGRTLAGEPERLIERALRADPGHVKALLLSGMAASKRQDPAAALAAWERALQHVPPGDPLAAQLRGAMAQARASQPPLAASVPGLAPRK